jgi:hypothetical protein
MNRSLNSFSRFVLVFVSVLAYSSRFAIAAAADSWKAEWEQTLSAAKKEGEVYFYGSQGYEKVFEIFQKRYPEIKVASNTVRRGSEHGQAVMSDGERENISSTFLSMVW